MKRMICCVVLVAGLLMAAGCCCPGGPTGGCNWLGCGATPAAQSPAPVCAQ